MLLSPAQINAYDRDGFLVIDGFVGADVRARLIARAEAIVADFDPGPRRAFSTREERARADNDVQFASAYGIHCFFEEDAFDGEGAFRQPKELSVRKIGHALHDLDPVFEAFSYDPRHAALLADLGHPDALALQGIVVCKQPRIGGEIGCHQDASWHYTDPVTLIGLWFALEDAHIGNGCLWVAPGGHRGPLRERFARTAGGGFVLETLDPTPFPRAPDDLVPVEVAAGSVVVLHGLVPHWSGKNSSDQRRLAYALHCIDAGAEYPDWNWRPHASWRRLDRSELRCPPHPPPLHAPPPSPEQPPRSPSR